MLWIGFGPTVWLYRLVERQYPEKWACGTVAYTLQGGAVIEQQHVTVPI